MPDARYIQAVDHTLGREQRVRTPNLAQSDDADFMAGVLHGAAEPVHGGFQATGGGQKLTRDLQNFHAGCLMGWG